MAERLFQNLEHKVAVITGGAGSIGRAISFTLAEHKIKTVILGRNPENAFQVAEDIKQKTLTPSISVQADLTSQDSLIKAKELIQNNFGKVDFLINCAGGGSPDAATSMEQIESNESTTGSFFDLSIEGFQIVFNLNILGTVLPCMIFMPDMLEKGRGSVVNVSSMAADQPLTKTPAYSAAKAAVDNFTKWLAVHFAKTGIRINAIAPGFFATKQNRFLLFNEDGKLSERGYKITSNTPMGKIGNVDDLGGTVVYLISNASTFVTGTIIPVDGGFSAYGGV